jgi:prolipoprotein diacylglyceryltransferase
MIPSPKTTRRSWSLIVIIGLLLFSQAGAVLNALRIPSEVAHNLSLPPYVQVIAAIFWTLLFGWVAISLLRRNPLAVKRAFLSVVVFVAYSVLRVLIFAQSDYDRQRFPFLLALSLLLAVLLVSVYMLYRHLCTRRRGRNSPMENGTNGQQS